MTEIIGDKEKDFDFTETISNEIIETPTYDYGQSQTPLDYNIAIRNKPSDGGGSNLYCFATLSTDEITISGTSKTLTLNTFDTNDSGMSVTSGRITITQDGLYCLTGAVTFASNASGAREVLLRKNGTSHTDLHYTVSGISGDLTSCVFTRYLNYVVGDYIEVRAYQTSGGSLNVTSNTKKTFVQVVKIN